MKKMMAGTTLRRNHGRDATSSVVRNATPSRA
jgi:hypothetical protein